MCRFPGLVLAMLALPLWISAAQASELSAAVTLTSEYIYRGLALSDGDPALQLGVDYAHDSGFFIGAWGSTVDLYGPGGETDFELDYYAGYHHEFQAPFTTTATLIRYTWPGQDGPYDSDYNELLLNASWREHYAIELGYTDDLYGSGADGHHWEVQFDWPFANAWVLGAALGRNDLSEAGGSRYYYWNLGASARYSRLVVDVRWFNNEEPYGFAAGASAGSRLVVSLTAAF